MKKWCVILLTSVLLSLVAGDTVAQCSICTRTAQQLGEKPAKGLNTGIVYLAFTPLMIMGFVGYRWWKNNRQE